MNFAGTLFYQNNNVNKTTCVSQSRVSLDLQSMERTYFTHLSTKKIKDEKTDKFVVCFREKAD